VIAHCLSTITNADRIVGRWTHQELLDKKVMCFEFYRTGFQK
jgi:ABC-type transport system involved in Fe-S cluster assembly fused permease/ATPase subunit